MLSGNKTARASAAAAIPNTSPPSPPTRMKIHIHTPFLYMSTKNAFTFADVPLLYEPPEHVAAVVAVGGLVKRFLAEAVPVDGWGLG